MAGRSINREYVFSLGGIFFLTAFAALGLKLLRQVGPALPMLLVLTPLPPFFYLLLIRSWMRQSDSTEISHSKKVTVLLYLGLAVVVLISLWMAFAILYTWGVTGFSPPQSRSFPIQALDQPE